MKSIAQLREKAPYVLKRKGHAKQKKKLLKAYHGKRLKMLWAAFQNADGFLSIAQLKDIEGVGHRMKGRCRRNHIYKE